MVLCIRQPEEEYKETTREKCTNSTRGDERDFNRAADRFKVLLPIRIRLSMHDADPDSSFVTEKLFVVSKI
jgi:hypothetical protein